jgi:biopolymer transport protein ExbD
MRIPFPVRPHKARLEIIPLIDIMFFLLASFMMVSIHMIRLEALRMDLPTPTPAPLTGRPALIQVEVDAVGDAFVIEGRERVRKTLPALREYLVSRAADPRVSAYIQGSPKATHGQVIAILDLCRHAGVRKVSYNLSSYRPSTSQ